MQPDQDLVATGRRVSAARKRAGIKTRRELAGLLRERGLPRMGPETIGKIERGERAFNDYEIQPFADALHVSRAFLLEDAIQESQLDRIERRLEESVVLMAAMSAQLVALGAPAVEIPGQGEGGAPSGR